VLVRAGAREDGELDYLPTAVRDAVWSDPRVETRPSTLLYEGHAPAIEGRGKLDPLRGPTRTPMGRSAAGRVLSPEGYGLADITKASSRA
jgi:hypothetical protein